MSQMAECVNCGETIDVDAQQNRWVHVITEDAYCESVDPHADRHAIAMPSW